MATATVAEKLKIKEGQTLFPVNAPPGFKNNLAPLPAGVIISETAKSFHQVHWFVMDKAQMEKEMKKVLKLVQDDVTCWIYYPKGSSKVQTDLTRDKGWDELLKQDMQWLTLISFDDTWSAFAMRRKTAADLQKDSKPKARPVFDYIDPVKKTFILPDDMADALQKKKKQQEFFNTLSFSNKKEYIEWIVTAKKAETRIQRVNDMIERLGKQWKNPRNI
jgi:hypothetical protein